MNVRAPPTEPLVPAPASPDDDSTGLPFAQSWSRVYAYVTLLFFLWVGLLLVLARAFS